jgi:hypothetical protein
MVGLLVRLPDSTRAVAVGAGLAISAASDSEDRPATPTGP